MSNIIFLYLVSGLYYAAYLFLVAAGLTIIFGLARVVNLAHGALYAIGAYVAAWLMGLISKQIPPPLWYIIIIIAGAAGAAFVGIIIEPLLLRRVYGRLEEFQLLLTFAILLIIEDLELMIWGPYPLAFKEPYHYLGAVSIGGGLMYPLYGFVVIAMGWLIALFLWFFMTKTKLGIIIRSAAANKEVTAAIGHNVKSIYTKTFILGATLAGIGGAIVMPSATAQLGLGIDILVFAFAVVVIGGLGSLKGALVGSLIVGMTRVVGIAYFPEIELALIWLIAVIVLVFRPLGLWGRE